MQTIKGQGMDPSGKGADERPVRRPVPSEMRADKERRRIQNYNASAVRRRAGERDAAPDAEYPLKRIDPAAAMALDQVYVPERFLSKI